MATIQELMLRAQLLRQETAVDSISPERAGSIMYDTLAYINQMQLQDANPLLISKIYTSVAAMEADSAPVSDLTGKPLRPGQVVVIASADSDNGLVYRYNGGTESRWTVVGKIGNLTPEDSLTSDSTQLPLAARQGKVLDEKVSDLGQVLGEPKNSEFAAVGFVRYTTGVKESSGYHTTDFIPVTQGQKVHCYASASASVAAISAYSSNTEASYMQSASVQGQGGGLKTYEYIVPQGVAYIRASTNDSVIGDSWLIVLQSTPFFAEKSEITTINSALQPSFSLLGKPESKQFSAVGFVRYTTGVRESGGYHTTDFIPVTEGQKVYFYGYASASVAAISAYSSNTEASYLQAKSLQGGGTQFRVYVVPSGVAYIRASTSDSSAATFLYVCQSNAPLATLAEVSDLVNAASEQNAHTRLFPKTKLPCVSFNFDDIPAGDSQLVTLFESYGLTCGFAFIASAANITAKAATYRNYQLRGFDVLNHSVDATIFNTTNYTYQTALEAIRTAKYRLEDAGIICNGFVSPSSQMASSFMPILKLFHAYAFTSTTTSPTENGRAQDPCDLHRFSLESHTLAQIEQFIDDCITNDQIITFYGHAANLVDGDTSVFSIARITAVIEYCLAKRNNWLLYVGGTDECVKYFFDL